MNYGLKDGETVEVGGREAPHLEIFIRQAAGQETLILFRPENIEHDLEGYLRPVQASFSSQAANITANQPAIASNQSSIAINQSSKNSLQVLSSIGACPSGGLAELTTSFPQHHPSHLQHAQKSAGRLQSSIMNKNQI